MRISTKSRHAITAMLELALQDRPMKLSMMSDNNAISMSYLEQIFASLRLKGLVKGQRGPGGGYVLGKQAADISIAEIISSVDEWVEYRNSIPPEKTKAKPQKRLAVGSICSVDATARAEILIIQYGRPSNSFVANSHVKEP